MLWENIFSHEFPEKVAESNGVCLLPVGAMEARGPHLSVGSDVLTVLARCEKAAEMEPCVVFPPLYFGEASGGDIAPGTICYSDELIFDVLEQSCYEAYRNGFTKIYLVSGTAENDQLLQNFCRMMLQKNLPFVILTAGGAVPGKNLGYIIEHREEFPWLTDEDIAVIQSYRSAKKKDRQGGFYKTGIAWGANSACVRPEKFDTVNPGESAVLPDFPAGLYAPFVRFAKRPDFASFDKHAGLNERIAKAFFLYSCSLLAENVKFLKEDTTILEYNREWLAKQKAMPQR